jgi:Holliday junction resolvasome RuvABC endonuclease subunit
MECGTLIAGLPNGSGWDRIILVANTGCPSPISTLMSPQRILAIDPGLQSTGWALFDVHTTSLLGVGRLKALDATHTLSVRLGNLQLKIADLLGQMQLGMNDFLVCEAPTTMKDPEAAHKIEQVRGIFETLARAQLVSVPGRINPRSVHFEVMGMRGHQLDRETIKETAWRLAEHLYGSCLDALGFSVKEYSLQQKPDIADALLLGGLAVQRVASALRAGMAVDEYFENQTGKAKRRPRPMGR